MSRRNFETVLKPNAFNFVFITVLITSSVSQKKMLLGKEYRLNESWWCKTKKYLGTCYDILGVFDLKKKS